MDEVLVDVRDGWRRITLNRPDKLNAFTDSLHARLADAISAAEADPACRALLVTGAGRGFCAGQDLNARNPSAEPQDTGGALERWYNPLIRRLRTLRMPTVCAVNGVAAGAGANFALAFDIVLAARSARFIQAFARIGLVPDAGGTFFLPRLVGDARARGMALLAEPIDGETAAAWGLVWRCVADDDLTAESEALAGRLAVAPTASLVATRRLLDTSWSNDLSAQLDAERDAQRQAGRGPDYVEGVRAFLEKRPAVFTGRAPGP